MRHNTKTPEPASAERKKAQSSMRRTARRKAEKACATEGAKGTASNAKEAPSEAHSALENL